MGDLLEEIAEGWGERRRERWGAWQVSGKQTIQGCGINPKEMRNHGPF